MTYKLFVITTFAFGKCIKSSQPTWFEGKKKKSDIFGIGMNYLEVKEDLGLYI